MTPAEKYAAQFGGKPQADAFRTGPYVGNAAQFSKPIYEQKQAKPSIVNQFTTKFSDVAKQTGSLAFNAGKATANFVKNTPGYIKQDVQPFLQGVARTVTGDLSHDIRNVKVQGDVLDRQILEVTQQYKAGKISRENYSKRLKDIADQAQGLHTDLQTIQSKADRGNIVESAIMTGADILSTGSLKLGEVGGKQAIQAGSKEALNALLDAGSTNLEKAAMRIPNVRSLLIRNLEAEGRIFASETLPGLLAREGKQVAAGLLIKRPIFYQSNLGLATETLNHIMEGNYSAAAKSGAWIGIQALEGGPLGAASKAFSWLKTGTNKLAYGKGSFIDELSSRIGNGDRRQIASFINKNQDAEEVYRVVQETNRRVHGQDVNAAVDQFLTSYAGQNLDQLTPEQITKDLLNWREADTVAHTELQKLVKAGKLTQDQADRLTPVRWDAGTRNGAAQAIAKAGPDQAAQQQAWERYAELKGLDNNPRLMDRVKYEIAKNAGGSGDAAMAVQGIDAAATIAEGVPKVAERKLAKLGYVLAEPAGGRKVNYLELGDTPKLISASAKGNLDLFDPAVAAQPQVQQIAGALRSAGLSPEAASKEGNRKLTEAVVNRLQGTFAGQELTRLSKNGDEVAGGQGILSTLQSYIENKAPSRVGQVLSFGTADKAAITDLRQLTKKEIVEALSTRDFRLTTKDAKDIQKAIARAYVDVPMELRGLGDKAVDYLYTFNPLQKSYSRIQSALRYTYNPFFRTQEATETRLLSHTSANNLIWNKTRGELNDAVKVLDDARIFSSSLYGEAAQDQVLGRITANITQGQKRDLAGLALDIANKRGIPLEKMVLDHPGEIDDALRVIVQYPTKGILASPLARTLNLVFFPMRYNAKVTMVAAQALAKQPPAIQKAVLHSLFQFGGWLKTDEGLKWQQQYADAIGVLNWITPINSIEYTLNLLNGSIDSPADLGILGGLPIGVISQILDSQGLIHLNSPYVNPKTGDVIPKYVPATTKARAATAVSDILGSMFTYPGRTLGLPGKTENIHRAVQTFIDTNKGDYTFPDQTDRLTPLQQNMIRVLKGDTSKEALDALYSAAAPGQFNGYTLPPANVGSLIKPPAPLKPRTGLPSKAKGKKSKTKAIPIGS